MNKDKAYWSAIIRTLVAKEMRVEPETIDPDQNLPVMVLIRLLLCLCLGFRRSDEIRT